VILILGVFVMLMMACVLYLSRDTGQHKGVDWLYIGAMELNLFGHLSEETRPKIVRLWATGDAETRARAAGLLDQESFMHAGHERLARIEELAARLQMMELKDKLGHRQELPAWIPPRRS
jgi:hypothetical protein